jgi:hypothetical protein
MGNSSVGIQGDPDTQNAILAQRRCIILAIVGSTPASNRSMTLIMESGYLSCVKLWLDDILSGLIGEFLEALDYFFPSNHALVSTQCCSILRRG